MKNRFWPVVKQSLRLWRHVKISDALVAFVTRFFFKSCRGSALHSTAGVCRNPSLVSLEHFLPKFCCEMLLAAEAVCQSSFSQLVFIDFLSPHWCCEIGLAAEAEYLCLKLLCF